ncbi:hypothetical protein [Tenacibaculum sp. 190524A05c]|uniref:hypothetical protein n=1 Tax=Tenacibaculum platacis TaxID=3137852 RepID=UPI0031FAD3B2
MNKQRKTYILLAAVIIIWSFVGFQFLGYLESDDEVLSEVAYKKFVPKKAKDKELYKVETHDRDPFLDKYNKPKKKIKFIPKKKKDPVIFPQIRYKGSINNNGKLLFIVTINGSQKIVKLNQVVNEVEVVSGDNKEIKVKYKGEVKIFKK